MKRLHVAAARAALRRQLNELWRFAASPVYKVVLRFTPTPNAWDVLKDVPIEVAAFGAGSVHPFQHYFDGVLRSDVSTITELEAWLRGCAYDTDANLFGLPDHWQHPVEFEKTRRGDCDDHALWTWRKLCELGYDATLVAGDLARDRTPETHLWVMLQDSRTHELIVETTAKGTKPMFIPLHLSRNAYRPYCSVDAQFRRLCYGGLLLHLQERYASARRRVP